VPRVVSVAVPIPKNQTFDYLLPDAMEERARVGSVLLVPFGSRRMTGYLVAYPDASARGDLRDVVRVLDLPPLSDELVTLGRWISEYYVTSLGEALHAMVPAPAKQGAARLVVLTGAGQERAEWDRFGEGGRAVLECLSAGPIAARALRHRVGDGVSVDYWLRRLAEAGFVETRFRPPRAAEALREFVALAAAPDALRAWLDGPGKRSPARARVLEAVASSGSPVAYDALRERAGATRSLLAYLESEGLVSVERRPIPQSLDAFRIDETITEIDWTDEQRAVAARVVDRLAERRFQVLLLHGATGSGKTFVYMEAARLAVAAGRTALVLVPEISLTPQTVHRFHTAFPGRVAVLHSLLPDAERVAIWHDIARGGKDVVIGARSAVFAPLPRLGLVVVDEEHEGAYKQEEAPRYHARDVAIYRGRLAEALVLLGSATPSLETLQNARTGRYERLVLERGRPLPPIETVDLRTAPPGPSRYLSEPLLERIERTTEDGGQVILLLNRRGYSVFLLCEGCGYVPRCPHCSVTLTFHLRGQRLLCHYCGRSEKAPAACPACGGPAFRHKGTGTQRVEEELRARLPGLRLARMDLDATRRRGAHGEILRAFARGDIQCLLGTQMIAKGLDFPGVRLVGVISADTALHLPDFRAGERTFSLLVQVAGRAGRGDGRGVVLIQTWVPEHAAITHAARYAAAEFMERELADREGLRFPPFSSLIVVTLRGRDEDVVQRTASAVAPRISGHPGFASAYHEILGPAPAPIAKVRDRHRWQILLKARRDQWRLARRVLRETLADAGRDRQAVEVIVDVDALSLL
jgi:primosomal protein N' (replication factor Y)